MSKVKGNIPAATLPPVVKFPKTLYAAVADHGTPHEYLITASTPEEVHYTGEAHVRSVKVARYVLVGTGVIHADTPYYVENATP